MCPRQMNQASKKLIVEVGALSLDSKLDILGWYLGIQENMSKGNSCTAPVAAHLVQWYGGEILDT